MRDFEFGQAVLAGFDLLRRRPLATLGLAMIGALATVSARLSFVVATHFMTNRSEQSMSVVLISTLNALFGLLLFGGLSATIGGAVMRAADEGQGFLRPRFGGDEARLFVLFLLVIPALIVAALVVGVGTMLMRPGETGLGLLTAPLAVVATVVICGPASRLWLAGPMTVRDGRLRLMASWRLTRGRAWKSFAVLLGAALIGGVAYYLGNLLLNRTAAALHLTMPVEVYGPSLGAALTAILVQPLNMAFTLLRGGMIGLMIILLAAPAADIHRRLIGDPAADQAAVFD